jgi:hypothetical protein
MRHIKKHEEKYFEKLRIGIGIAVTDYFVPFRADGG